MGVAFPGYNLLVRLIEPWIDDLGRHYPAGLPRFLRVAVYRRWRPVGDYFGRDVVRVRIRGTAIEYDHAVCCGTLLGPWTFPRDRYEILGDVKMSPIALPEKKPDTPPSRPYIRPAGCGCRKARSPDDAIPPIPSPHRNIPFLGVPRPPASSGDLPRADSPARGGPPWTRAEPYAAQA